MGLSVANQKLMQGDTHPTMMGIRTAHLLASSHARLAESGPVIFMLRIGLPPNPA